MQKNEHKTDAFLKKFYNNSLKLSDLLDIEYDEASPFKLIEEKKDVHTFDYVYDLKGNMKRSIYIMLYKVNHILKYKKYMEN